MDFRISWQLSMLLFWIYGLYSGNASLKDVPLPYNGLVGLMDSLVYMKRYGYVSVDPAKGGERDQLDSISVGNGISHFQRYMGLNVTAVLDDNTMKAIYNPRCGCVDPIEKTPSLRSLDKYTLAGGKWNKTFLTYRFTGPFPHNLSRRVVSESTREAFALYSQVIPLMFEEVRRKTSSDIEIHFASVSENMDGSGNAVGRSYPPVANDPRAGKIYLDVDEEYTTTGPDGLPFLAVVTHQIGHVLGLGHTSDHSSMMSPCVKKFQPTYSLGEEDIKGLNALYSRTEVDRSETASPTLFPNQNSLEEYCRIDAFDAISLIRNTFFLLKSGRVWKVSIDGEPLLPKEGVPVNHEWPEIDDEIHTLFQNSFDRTVIITSSKMYEYSDGGSLLHGSPSILRTLNLPKNIDAAFSLGDSGNGNSFIVRGSRVWLLHEASRTTDPRSPLSSRRLWNINLRGLTATFVHQGFLYFIMEKGYTRMELETLQLDNTREGNFAADFLGC